MELLILFVAAGMTIGTFFIGLSLAIEASPQNEDEVMPWFLVWRTIPNRCKRFWRLRKETLLFRALGYGFMWVAGSILSVCLYSEMSGKSLVLFVTALLIFPVFWEWLMFAVMKGVACMYAKYRC